MINEEMIKGRRVYKWRQKHSS